MIGSVKTIDLLRKWFSDLQIIETPDFHRMPSSVTSEFFADVDANSNEESDEVGQTKFLERIASQIKSSPASRFVIFTAESARGAIVQEALESFGIASVMVFGEMIVEHRMLNLNRYRRGEVRVLIGGEVISRGLALDTDHVVLFDMPHNTGQLLHRIGRTGVLARPGKATCFIKPDDEVIANEMRSGSRFEVTYPTRSKRKSSQEKNFASTQLDSELSELSD